MGMMMNEESVFNHLVNNNILFKEKNADHNEIEIFFTQIFALASNALQKRYSDYLLRVLPSKETVYKGVEEIDDDTVKALRDFMEVFTKSKNINPLEFGKIKFYFDTFFFSLTEKGHLDYLYDDDYLLTVEEAGDELKVSRPTINKYGKNGQLEVLNTTKHKKVPIHAIEIWEDTDLHVKVQTLQMLFWKRDTDLYKQYEELLDKIKEFESMYDDQSFEVVYKDVLSGEKHWDEVDSVSDYSEWEMLIEDLNELKEKLGI